MTGRAAESLIAARRRDTSRRRKRVLSALDQLTAAGQDISVSAVARAALFTARSSTGITTCEPRSMRGPPPRRQPGIHGRQQADPARGPCQPPGAEPAAAEAEHRPHRPAVGDTRRGGLPRQRNRARRRYRGTACPRRPAGTASARPAPGTRRANRRRRCLTRSQPRPYGTRQPDAVIQWRGTMPRAVPYASRRICGVPWRS
jgi:hypothetical protein